MTRDQPGFAIMDTAYLFYDPDGRGILIAMAYRVLKNNDIAGWYYGYAGNSRYESRYFLVTRNAMLEPVHYYTGDSPKEWDRDLLQSRSRLEATLFVPGAVQQALAEIRAAFADQWLLHDEKNDTYKLDKTRLKAMEPEEDDSYSYLSDGADRAFIGFLARHWSLQQPTLPPEHR